ncbi:MAG: META domain-containing protein, partial [bacterium]|nr:META domain-containing protein [bacterium]
MRKKMMTGLCALVALTGMLGACSSAETDAKQLEGKWNVTAINGSAVEQVEKLPSMEFDMTGKKLHGTTSCNLYNSGLELDEAHPSTLRITQAITTMMACPNMEVEQLFLQTLDRVASVKTG